MKSIKAVIAVLMAAALTISFCSCGTKRNRNREVSSSVVSETQNEYADEIKSEAENEYIDEVQSEEEIEDDLTNSEDNEPVESVEEQSEETESEEENVGDKAAVQAKMIEIVSSSNAVGYTIGHIDGSDNSFLMLSFGEIEAARYYDVYRIDADDVVLVQEKLVGSHTGVYISEDTGNLAIYQAHMGVYGYGDLIYTEHGVTVDLIKNSGSALQHLEIRQYSCGVVPNTEQIILRLNCSTYFQTAP